MSIETKKRLLLSKWRADQGLGCKDRGGDADWLNTLHERDERLATTLTDVKYWLHDGIVHHRLVSNPREILRKVEDALG